VVDYLVKRDNLSDSSVVTEAMIEKNLKGYKIHKTKETNKISNKKVKTKTMNLREMREHFRRILISPNNSL